MNLFVFNLVRHFVFSSLVCISEKSKRPSALSLLASSESSTIQWGSTTQLLNPFFSWQTANLLEQLTSPKVSFCWIYSDPYNNLCIIHLALQVTCTILEQFNSTAMHNLCNMVKNLQCILNCIHVSPDQTFSSLGIGPVLVDSFVLCFSLSSKEKHCIF